MKKYLKLMRIHHYLKNGIIFLPLIFSGHLLIPAELLKCILGFVAFSLAASTIYIINDIQDAENDRRHKVKRHRSIASGEVSIPSAWSLTIALITLSATFNFLAIGLALLPWTLIGLYIILNILYSGGLKNIPLVDLVILVAGYLIRLFYGSAIVNIDVSSWLYLTVTAISFYLVLGKRRNEMIEQGNNARVVLKQYNQKFLDKNMYLCLALAIIFYSLWCNDINASATYSARYILWTVPLVMLISMKYGLNIEVGTNGDPVEVILGDKVLIALLLIYAVIIFLIIYG